MQGGGLGTVTEWEVTAKAVPPRLLQLPGADVTSGHSARGRGVMGICLARPPFSCERQAGPDKGWTTICSGVLCTEESYV